MLSKLSLVFILLFFIGSDHQQFFIWSIWLNTPFGLHPSWLLGSVVVVSNILYLKHIKIDRVYYLFGLLFFLGLISALLDFDFVLRQWVIDIKFFVITLSVYSLFKGLFTKNNQIFMPTVMLIMFLVVIRTSTDFILLVMNSGTDFIPGVTRITLDSAKTTILLLVTLIGVLFLRFKWFLFIFPLLVMAISLSYGYGSRMVYFDLILIGLSSVFLLRKRQIIVFVSVLVLGSLLAFYTLSLFNTKNAEITFARANNIVEGRPFETFVVKTEYNYISRIDPIRYAQFQNIFLQDLTVKRVLIGRGIGGYYDDDYVDFPANLGSTFTPFENETNHFYRTHNFVSHFFMKYGLVGLLIICYLWLSPVWISRKYWLLKTNFNFNDAYILTFFIFLPVALIELTWSGKGMMISGMIMAICYRWISMERENGRTFKQTGN